MQLGPVTPKILSTINTAVVDHGQTKNERHCQRRTELALEAKGNVARGADSIRAPRRAAWFLAVLALPLFLCGTVRAGQPASLAWSSTPGVAGYALYRGTNSGTYPSRYDVGTNTTITLTGLKEGQTNYFAVASYNSARMESSLSTEVAFIVPGLARLTLPTRAGNPTAISFPVAIGHTYSVQASTDLKNWTTVFTTTSATSNAWTSWQDPQSSSFKSRFYRLIMN